MSRKDRHSYVESYILAMVEQGKLEPDSLEELLRLLMQNSATDASFLSVFQRVIRTLNPESVRGTAVEVVLRYVSDLDNLRTVPMPDADTALARSISEKELMQMCDALIEIVPEFVPSREMLRTVIEKWSPISGEPHSLSPDIVELILKHENYDGFIKEARARKIMVSDSLAKGGQKIIPYLGEFQHQKYQCVKKVIHYCLLVSPT